MWRNYFNPDVVWDTSASQMLMSGVYRGHEGDCFSVYDLRRGKVTSFRLYESRAAALKAAGLPPAGPRA